VDRIKRWIRPLGHVLTVLALIYLVNIIAQFDWNALHFGNPLKGIGYMLLFGVWATLLIFIGVYNWKLIFEFIKGSSVPTKEVLDVYLKSNIAKYLPGNVMHFAGRNYLGSKLGWKNSDVAFSSLLEYVFGAGTTGIIIVVFIALGLINIPAQVSLKINIDKILGYLSVGVIGGIALIAIMYAYRYYLRKEPLRSTSGRLWNTIKQFFTAGFLVLFAKLLLISLLCFILNCFYYFYLCELVLDFHIKPADFFNANAALSIANYTSILTPGVPAGLGIKESVSFLLISAYGYPRESLMISIVVFRITCILGDLLSFLFVIFPRGKRIFFV